MSSSTRAAAPVEVVRYERTRVQVLHGPDRGLVVEGAGRTLIVGTSPDCDLALRDDTVSRKHCEIELTELGFRVRDLGSTNGLRVHGMRVFDLAATDALELKLGETVLRISPLSQTEDRERVTSHQFGDVLGGSAKMRELFAQLERYAPTNLSVLIEGETGTGKDLVAESIHRASARADGPYVVFDCSAVSPNLVESELFGHERGAFTGSVGQRQGVFEEAHGGTLFLDELGELPKDLQPKLLRALEKREIKRVGGKGTISVDVRVLAATNRNLLAEVGSGQFRQDLYYRVAGARVFVPPLRERLDDLPRLVNHFLALEGEPSDTVPASVWALLSSHRWPGNVRELRNAVQRMVATSELALQRDDQYAPGHTPSSATTAPEKLEPLRIARRDAADAFERSYLEALLQRTDGNVTRAAAVAEVSRQMVQKLMKKHGLREPPG